MMQLRQGVEVQEFAAGVVPLAVNHATLYVYGDSVCAQPASPPQCTLSRVSMPRPLVVETHDV